jgi:hypothetical protein
MPRTPLSATCTPHKLCTKHTRTYIHTRTHTHTHIYTHTHKNTHRHFDPQEALEHMLTSSGKLQLLDRMLSRLLPKGHRVLIYSQVFFVLGVLLRWLSVCLLAWHIAYCNFCSPRPSGPYLHPGMLCYVHNPPLAHTFISARGFLPVKA